MTTNTQRIPPLEPIAPPVRYVVTLNVSERERKILRAFFGQHSNPDYVAKANNSPSLTGAITNDGEIAALGLADALYHAFNGAA